MFAFLLHNLMKMLKSLCFRKIEPQKKLAKNYAKRKLVFSKLLFNFVKIYRKSYS